MCDRCGYERKSCTINCSFVLKRGMLGWSELSEPHTSDVNQISPFIYLPYVCHSVRVYLSSISTICNINFYCVCVVTRDSTIQCMWSLRAKYNRAKTST